jgi:glutamate-1-semialdehyde 2,1-aminomutase
MSNVETPPISPRHAASAALFRRAVELIPGGYHLSGRPLLTPEDSPMYIERGAGCRCWDIDGHEYLDYFMAFGPHLLGYAHPEVDAAAIDQLRRGTPLSLNHPLHVRFIERLVGRFPGADMGLFFRSGSEATTAALRIARRATGRRRVVRCGYHGWHDWCLPLEPAVPAGLADQIVELPAAHPEALDALLRAHPGEFAAVIVAPEMLHPPRSPVFAALIERAHEHGAVFILDEVKTGFRIRPGSMQQHLGIVPDLTTLGKALGNGWAVAAVIGAREVMQQAAGLHLSGTYHGDTASMAAAMATLDILDRTDVTGHVWRLGERLIAGLQAAAQAHGAPATAYGEPLPPMPFLRFTHPDPAINDRLRDRFYAESLAAGILLHPRHLWFISHAHQEADIERTLSVARAAMATLAEEFPEAMIHGRGR